MPEQRVLQVTGMSDRALLNHSDPSSSENRRIELFILTTPAAEVINTLFGQSPNSESKNELDKARDKAKFNQPVFRTDTIRFDAGDASNATSNVQAL
jgi:chemotaxis protein MotB